MKIIPLFVLLFFHSSLDAQVSFNIMPDSIRIDHKFHDGDNDNYHSISYDTLVNGHFTFGSEYLLDSIFTSKPFIKRFHEYDLNWNAIRFMEYERNKNGEIIISTEKDYNEHGQLLLYKNVNTSSEKIEKYSYTNFDSLSSKLISYKKTSPYQKYFIKYEYDYYPDHNLFHEIISSKGDTGQWKILKNLTYTYGHSSFADTVIIDTNRYIHFKDGNRRDTLISHQYLSQGSWLLGKMERLLFNAEGKLLKHTYYSSHNNWSAAYVEEWKYDSLGFLSEYEYSVYGGGGNGSRYSYYSNGRIKSWFEYWYSTHGGGGFNQHNYSYAKLALPEDKQGYDFTVFPNPTKDILNAMIFSPNKTIYTIELHNYLGQVIRLETLELPSGYSKIELPLNNISSGFYLINIGNGSNNKIKKFIVGE